MLVMQKFKVSYRYRNASQSRGLLRTTLTVHIYCVLKITENEGGALGKGLNHFEQVISQSAFMDFTGQVMHWWKVMMIWYYSLWSGMYSHDHAATAQLDSGTSHTENQVKFSCISLIYQFFIFTTNTLSSFSVWYTLKYFYTQTFVCLWKCLLIFVTLFWTCCTLFVQLLSPCLLANWQYFLCTIFTGEKNQINLKFYMIVLVERKCWV